jgi:hypothetical protein
MVQNNPVLKPDAIGKKNGCAGVTGTVVSRMTVPDAVSESHNLIVSAVPLDTMMPPTTPEPVLTSPDALIARGENDSQTLFAMLNPLIFLWSRSP